MNSGDSYENLAVYVALAGCGAAILFAVVVLICCHYLIKKGDNRYHSRHYNVSQSGYGFERQTTSDENGEFFSYCFEDSVHQPEEQEVRGAQSASEQAIVHKTIPEESEPSTDAQSDAPTSSEQRIRFASTSKTRKTSLPSKAASYTFDEQNKPGKPSDQRRASAGHAVHGIVRQESFDESEDVCEESKGENICEKVETEDVDDKSPETMRRQYKELWQLRATFEAEEENEAELSNSKNDSKLSKNDSGYRSIERRDYSIDYKTESIYRQFTSITSQKTSHQSIQEEQEAEAFV